MTFNEAGLPADQGVGATVPRCISCACTCNGACLCHVVVPDCGRMINQWASLGAQIVQLNARIPELEKLSRRTPPKTLVEEKKKVEAAKINLEICRKQLAVAEPELERLRIALESLKAWG